MFGSGRFFGFMVFIASLFAASAASAQSLEEAMRAALDGDVSAIQRTLDRGNSPDMSDAEGNTLLMLASREGHRALAAFLIERKASVNRKNKFGDTALLAASLKGKLDVAKLLLDSGAELNPQGWSPLHYAAFQGQTEMVRFLLDKGANKNAIAPNEYTALMLAVRGGHTEVAQALLFGDPEVNHKTSSGDSALKLANAKQYEPMVQLLRRAGAVE